MSLFKIERAVEAKKEELQEDATEVKEATSVEKQEVVPPGEGEAFSLDKKERPDVVLKVTGALGGVFTTALNKVLAIESMVMIPMSEDALSEAMDDSIVPVVIHAQVMDPELLNHADMVDLISDVSKHENERYVIGTERISPAPVLMALNRMSWFRNVDVKYTMTGVVHTVARRCMEALS